MEPSHLNPGPVPGLLVGQETQPTLPVINAAPETSPSLPRSTPLPTPNPKAGGASASGRPSRSPSSRVSRVGSGRTKASSSRSKRVSSRVAQISSRAVAVARDPAQALDAAHAQASWLGLSLVAAVSTFGLIAAVGFDFAQPSSPPPLHLDGQQAAQRHTFAVPGRAVALDPLVFHSDVEPVLKQECWSCHGEAGAGEFRLRSGEGGVDLASVLPFVAPGRPEASLLLTKPLGGAWGGMPHEGGPAWQPDDPQVLLFERWIAGSAVPSRVTPHDQESR